MPVFSSMRSGVQPGIADAMRALLTARRGTNEPTPRNLTFCIAVRLSPPATRAGSQRIRCWRNGRRAGSPGPKPGAGHSAIQIGAVRDGAGLPRQALLWALRSRIEHRRALSHCTGRASGSRAEQGEGFLGPRAKGCAIPREHDAAFEQDEVTVADLEQRLHLLVDDERRDAFFAQPAHGGPDLLADER